MSAEDAIVARLREYGIDGALAAQVEAAVREGKTTLEIVDIIDRASREIRFPVMDLPPGARPLTFPWWWRARTWMATRIAPWLDYE